MVVAQSLGGYGLLSGFAQGVSRVGMLAESWMNETGAMIAAAIVVGGWLTVKLLRL